jgi:hypothetical protein
MNKTLIALAIVAALPVAAQADATLSGSVNSKYTNAGVIDTDASLSITSSEVLANGMTATATFGILADHDDDTENQGTATLAGDFGMLSVGSIDADAAFQAGDVAGVVANTTESTDSTSSSVYGIHYAGTVAGLSVAAQLNAATGADKVAEAIPKSSQVSATYDMNGLTFGYSYASGAADAFSTAGHGTPVVANDGIDEAQSALGVSYAFGDLVVSAGKVNLKDSTKVSPDTVISATYTLTADALTVVAQMDNYHSATDTNDYQINMSYALSDSISLSSEIDKSKTTTMVATYTAGSMTATVARTDDDTTDSSVALDLGNADLTLARNGGDEETSVSYKVSF